MCVCIYIYIIYICIYMSIYIYTHTHNMGLWESLCLGARSAGASDGDLVVGFGLRGLGMIG